MYNIQFNWCETRKKSRNMMNLENFFNFWMVCLRNCETYSHRHLLMFVFCLSESTEHKTQSFIWKIIRNFFKFEFILNVNVIHDNNTFWLSYTTTSSSNNSFMYIEQIIIFCFVFPFFFCFVKICLTDKKRIHTMSLALAYFICEEVKINFFILFTWIHL